MRALPDIMKRSFNPLRPLILYSAAMAALLCAIAPSARAESVVVALDHSARLHVAGAAQSVVVGNPAVADVTVVDSHTIYVSGRGYGVTDVVVLDSGGHSLFSGEVQVTTPNTGRVSVWRGSDRTDMACAPSCQASVRSAAAKGGGDASGGSSSPAAAAPPPGGGMPSIPSQ